MSSIGYSTFPAIGFGAILYAAYAAGCTFWDTPDIYGDSEELIGKWFTPTRKHDEIFLSMKFRFIMEDFSINGSPTARGTPIAAVQVEYLPFTLDIEDPKINLLNIASELSKYPDDFEDTGFCKMIPWCASLTDGLKEIGVKYNGATGGQVALTWLLTQGDNIIPIPGTKKVKYLNENIAAGAVTLSVEDMQVVRDVAVKADTAQGERYLRGWVCRFLWRHLLWHNVAH
ncbi:NADP-dependent oxidoreductase domain-containing protein [Mycena maculata]|uniref:NADP-dependent oxidoreductase domain-containing protein n=1 Tax=Mycena maculata TaxID=230809 RepID=A0AAD7K3K4_9AGAR|nr:NADP-dependent oxidoreductase domain-containing protein [Mycena maculata]